MPVQMESFSDAWDKLASPGLDLTRASFEIGWELAHLAYAEEKELSGGGSQDTATTGGQQAHRPGAQGAVADHYEEILDVQDLSSLEDRQARVERIGAALWYFSSDPQNEIAASINVSLPNIDDLRAAAAGGKPDIRPALAAFHVTMVKACATLDGTTAAAPSNNTAPTLNGLREAYEVGRLLAVIVLKASDAGTDDEFRNLVSVDLGEMSLAQETEKETIAFDCVPKKIVPDGASTIEGEISMVGFADATGKKIDYYWRNTDLTPDVRPKGGVK